MGWNDNGLSPGEIAKIQARQKAALDATKARTKALEEAGVDVRAARQRERQLRRCNPEAIKKAAADARAARRR